MGRLGHGVKTERFLVDEVQNQHALKYLHGLKAAETLPSTNQRVSPTSPVITGQKIANVDSTGDPEAGDLPACFNYECLERQTGGTYQRKLSEQTKSLVRCASGSEEQISRSGFRQILWTGEEHAQQEANFQEN